MLWQHAKLEAQRLARRKPTEEALPAEHHRDTASTTVMVLRSTHVPGTLLTLTRSLSVRDKPV